MLRVGLSFTTNFLMNKAITIITGIISFLPLISWGVLLGHFLLFDTFLFFPVALGEVTIIATLALILYFTYKLITIETIPIWSKLLWFFRFLITGFIAMPFFWYYFILHEEKYARFE